jgi:hypothetical protein
MRNSVSLSPSTVSRHRHQHARLFVVLINGHCVMAKKLSGEAALLSWAAGAGSAHGLSVKNLSNAWADGLAFAAIAHRYVPCTTPPCCSTSNRTMRSEGVEGGVRAVRGVGWILVIAPFSPRVALCRRPFFLPPASPFLFPFPPHFMDFATACHSRRVGGATCFPSFSVQLFSR